MRFLLSKLILAGLLLSVGLNMYFMLSQIVVENNMEKLADGIAEDNKKLNTDTREIVEEYSDTASREYALMGSRAFTAFICSYFAHNMLSFDEAERLFSVGYKNGVTFIDAARSNLVSSEDIDSTVPIGVTLYIDNRSSADFILGQVYSAAIEEGREPIYAEDGYGGFPDLEIRQIRAGNEYYERNCELIE